MRFFNDVINFISEELTAENVCIATGSMMMASVIKSLRQGEYIICEPEINVCRSAIFIAPNMSSGLNSIGKYATEKVDFFRFTML